MAQGEYTYIKDGRPVNENAVVAELARELGKRDVDLIVQYIDENSRPFALLPANAVPTDLSKFLDRPLQVKQSPTFPDLDSFNAYVERFHDERSVIFASQDHSRITAILDYHRAEGASAGAENLLHSACLQLKLSDEWMEWDRYDRQSLSQSKLAEFLEEHELDIQDPPTAAILDVVRNLRLRKDSTFEKALDDVTGSVKFLWNEEVKERGDLKMPTVWTVGLRPYQHSDLVAIQVRLRYRLDEGKVTFEYRLQHADQVLETAFNGIVEKVRAANPIPVYLGTW